ncbi:hypothetical protein OBBRIDRAFT_319159 [Obba rivulosa]|uniref:Uncharacterized protein n=1 Tax=Obba rivulosa TaxID=1052685 RepID=A0A8E2DPM7_9APHY|nr:hypothetical protein OBBRIDRAFT_319159 [Obba rivulosa]
MMLLGGEKKPRTDCAGARSAGWDAVRDYINEDVVGDVALGRGAVGLETTNTQTGTTGQVATLRAAVVSSARSPGPGDRRAQDTTDDITDHDLRGNTSASARANRRTPRRMRLTRIPRQSAKQRHSWRPASNYRIAAFASVSTWLAYFVLFTARPMSALGDSGGSRGRRWARSWPK